MLYKAKNAIKFYDDYSSMISEAKHEATKIKGLKINSWTNASKMINSSCASKSSNNSENLLNEIRQMFIVCINQKKVLKNHTIK